MIVTKPKEQQAKHSSIAVQVSSDLTVQITPHESYEFLMPTKEVSLGYGTSDYAIRKAFLRNSSELHEGKHYVKGGTNCPTLPNSQPHQIFWTKRGVVRLGFFIKSERAKLFRDWAEDLVINKIEGQQKLFDVPNKNLPPAKRKHNRLTQERMIDILHDVCQIEDTVLRNSIAAKLKGGSHV